VARRLYEVLAHGSVDELSELLDADIEWHVPGSNPRSGTHVGRDATLALFRTRSGRSFQVLDVLTGDRFVMVLVHHRIDRDGDGSDARFVHVMRTHAGRITESWHFDENQAQLDEFLNRAG
jgi:ketosteroid isomerase-like protein